MGRIQILKCTVPGIAWRNIPRRWRQHVPPKNVGIQRKLPPKTLVCNEKITRRNNLEDHYLNYDKYKFIFQIMYKTDEPLLLDI
jgi:hypothetical protein